MILDAEYARIKQIYVAYPVIIRIPSDADFASRNSSIPKSLKAEPHIIYASIADFSISDLLPLCQDHKVSVVRRFT